MGVNISLVRAEADDTINHPEWDSGREAGDKTLAEILSDFDGDRQQVLDDEKEWRPVSVEELRDHIAQRGAHTHRSDSLLTYLSDGSWFIRISR